MEFKQIIKKINGLLSKEEEQLFDHWYNDSAAHRLYFKRVKENYSKIPEKIDLEDGWKKVVKRINIAPKKNTYWRYAVASILLLLLSTTFFYTYKSFNFLTNETSITITPGKDKAILTLDNGNNIVLEQGKNFEIKNMSSTGKKLVYQTTNTTPSEITYNYLTIPRGGQYFVELEDGTKVWLNSESKLKYPTSFIKGKGRQVELIYGEAYFDISPSSHHDGSLFTVHSSLQEITVMGTEFNIKAYKDENQSYTTLVEGKVIVTTAYAKEILHPNQQSIVEANNSIIEKKNVDTYNETSWKEGVFSFEKKSLKEIMKVLSRWYDMEVTFANKELENVKFVGVLGKEQNIKSILTTIKELEVINSYEIDGKHILLK